MKTWIIGFLLLAGLLLIGWIEKTEAASLKNYTYNYPYKWRMECGDKIAQYYRKGSNTYWQYVLKCLENTQDLVDTNKERDARIKALERISRRQSWKR